MKKLILLSLVLIFCLSGAASAAGIGGAETQGQFKFGIGLDQEFMSSRDLKFKSSNMEFLPGLEMVNSEIKNMHRTTIKGSFGVFDFLDVYVNLGAAQYEGKKELELGGVTQERDKFKARRGLAYGGGLKGTYVFKNGFLIGGDLQYLSHKRKFQETATDAITGEKEAIKGNVIFQEWQVAPYIGMKIGNWTPYLGMKYSDVKVKFKDEEGDWFKFMAKDKVGAFLGTDWRVSKHWRLNIEGRLVDETAVSAGITYRF